MDKTLIKNINIKSSILWLLLTLFSASAFSQNTTIRGVVKDSLTNEPLPFVSIKFEGTAIGTFSDDNGKFTLVGSNSRTQISISSLGYKTYRFDVKGGQATTKEILLTHEDLSLKEVIIVAGKSKYSKKNNPAVDLIQKVIEHKDNNNINSLDFYQFEEYERTIIALNEFKPDQPQFKRYKFLSKYMDSSIIDNKNILPVSVREKLSDIYYKKSPKNEKQIVKGYQLKGLDQNFETESVEAIMKEVFKNISIYDNSITLLLHNFVGPLSDHSSVNFYKWYINDTISIDNKRYVEMFFSPFNKRDVGFTGYLYISTDGTYGVKEAMLRTPSKMNINFVDEMIIQHTFEQNEYGKWVPDEQRMAIDLSLIDVVKVYVDKTRSFNKFDFNQPADSVYKTPAPIIFEKDYLKRAQTFWSENRPDDHKEDYKMGEMMKEINNDKFIKSTLIAGNIVASGYIATNKDPEKNKIDVGTIRSFYSYNSVEGSRFRLTGATTKNFHPNLYLYGYTAYGLRDKKLKYLGEATWSFREVEKHKDEFTKNNLSVAYKYDMNNLGQRFTQSERDNILLSLRSSNNEKLTYSREIRIDYEKEYYNGFSFKLSSHLFDDRPAGNLVFEKMDAMGYIENISGIKTTEVKVALRYAFKEKFYQQRRSRVSIPAERFIVGLAHTTGLKGIFGGEYNFNKSGLSIAKELWVAPFGKIMASAEGEKIWGEVPFPLLITPSANNSFTIQKGNFYLIEPLEFVHDQQVSWEIYYHMGGWLFNRIPLLRELKWREIVGFRGLYGELADRNNPQENRDMFLFPQQTYTTSNKPYMEYNIGIENIFKFFRVDYVRRLNYLHHPDINKDGFRISFDMTF